MKSRRRVFLHAFWKALGSAERVIERLRGVFVFWRWDVRIESGASVSNPGDVVIGGPLVICRGVKIRTSGPGSVVFGKGVVVCSHTTIEAAGGQVVIGDSIVIGEYSTIQGQGGVYLEDDVLLASHVHFISNHHEFEDPDIPISRQPDRPASLRVCRGAWIGIGSVVLSGSVIGENSVVAAGSIIRSSVPARSVFGGAPARLLKLHDADSGAWIRPPVNHGGMA